MRLTIFVLFSMCCSVEVLAQTCCSGGVPMSSNIGLPVSSMGTWQFALNYDLNVLKTLNSGTKTLDDTRSERVTKSLLFETGYAFTKKISADVFLSYVQQERHVLTYSGTINSSITNGIGDAVVLLKYAVVNNSSINWSVGGGPKFPLGKSDLTDEIGIPYGADLQPGSGTWDLIVWSNLTSQMKFRKSLGASLSMSYRSTGENSEYFGTSIYEFGDEYQFILGVSDRFVLSSFLIDPSMAFRYRKALRDLTSQQEIASTGGEWVFFNPGVSITILPNLSISSSVEIPVYSQVNGTQLTPTYRFTAGVFYILTKKEK